MQIFDVGMVTSSLDISIEGPMSSYSYTYTASFKSSRELQIQLSLKKQITGMKRETMKINFSDSHFLSEKGANLSKDRVSTYVHPKQDVASAVEQGGMAISGILGTTMGIMILTNVLM